MRYATLPYSNVCQLELLHLVCRIVGRLLVPPAVFDMLSVACDDGLNLPDPSLHRPTLVDGRAPVSGATYVAFEYIPGIPPSK